jgi:hypothetical protein
MDVDQDGNGTANVSGNSNASESNARTVTSDGKHVDIDGAPRPVANKAVSTVTTGYLALPPCTRLSSKTSILVLLA